MAEVILENLCKTYGGVAAVDGIDLQVPDGELLVLVGPSGCGKTTTLRMIAGLDEPTSGEIFIGGRSMRRLPPKDRHVAMVFQHFALYPHLDVFRNLAFGPKLQHVPRAEIEVRVRDAARRLGIEHLLQRRPTQLSGGERQRVAVGRAIVRNPQLFLFDEPLSNLDARWREALRTDLVAVQRQLGTTTIHVTHDQVEAMLIGQRIAVMDAGRIQQTGSPLEVYHAPANRFVAEFIGSPPMNFLPGRLEIIDDTPIFRCPPLQLKLPCRGLPDLHSWSGRELTFGIRPEDVLTVRPDRGVCESVPAEVLLVQSLGADTILRLRCGSHDLTARVPADQQHRVGERLEVFLDTAKSHLFDPLSGRTILSFGSYAGRGPEWHVAELARVQGTGPDP